MSLGLIAPAISVSDTLAPVPFRELPPYDGAAVLVMEDGTEYAVTTHVTGIVELLTGPRDQVLNESGVRRWQADVIGLPPHHEPGAEVTLRLPTGREGHGIVEGFGKVLRPGARALRDGAHLIGSGPPPIG